MFTPRIFNTMFIEYNSDAWIWGYELLSFILAITARNQAELVQNRDISKKERLERTMQNHIWHDEIGPEAADWHVQLTNSDPRQLRGFAHFSAEVSNVFIGYRGNYVWETRQTHNYTTASNTVHTYLCSFFYSKTLTVF